MIRTVRRRLALAALVVAALGCSKAEQAEDTAPAADLARYVLSDVPKDVAHPLLIDFGGKVQLVGYNIEPEGIVRPGSKAKLTMFWRSQQRLSPGWKLFTHLDAPWLPSKNLDDAGPLRKLVSTPDGGRRQALGPSLWEPGRVYVDEIEVDIDKNVDSAEVTVLAGIWHEGARPPKPEAEAEGKPAEPALEAPGLRLQVLSGPSDGQERGVVVHIPTGRKPALQKDEKASASAPTRQPAPAGAGPRQR